MDAAEVAHVGVRVVEVGHAGDRDREVEADAAGERPRQS